ncbi:MAG: TPM domain-containing protein [Verrucomicrobiota bacterium]|nr:TPM domain-containing protein [Verrucomicrobiota bacterium]
MRTKDFMAQLDHDRIVAAIGAAEEKTSGEIRVFIQHGEVDDDPLEFATAKFHQLEMTKTAERNAVLILVAPRARKFAVVGDEGIHQRCGEEFWNRLVMRMREHFKGEAFTDALVEGIQTVGASLGEHFPRQKDDRNELSDEIIEG